MKTGMSSSSATARINAVLPVPGGPCNNQPRRHGIPRLRYHFSLAFQNLASSTSSIAFAPSAKRSIGEPVVSCSTPRSSNDQPMGR